VAGSYGGRRLAVPTGDRTRPTTDRVREALFSSLEAMMDFDGARVLDGFAGSGGLGLEALSRGAASATLIEADPKVLTILRGNVALLGAPAEVIPGKVETVLAARTPTSPYDLVFLDPPYGIEEDVLAAVLTALGTNGWLSDDPIVVVERGRRCAEPPWPTGMETMRSKRYGETTLWYGRRS